jgi:hypothetical protein
MLAILVMLAILIERTSLKMANRKTVITLIEGIGDAGDFTNFFPMSAIEMLAAADLRWV